MFGFAVLNLLLQLQLQRFDLGTIRFSGLRSRYFIFFFELRVLSLQTLNRVLSRFKFGTELVVLRPESFHFIRLTLKL